MRGQSLSHLYDDNPITPIMEKNVAQFIIAMVALVALICGIVGADIYLHEANKDPLLDKGKQLVSDINLGDKVLIVYHERNGEIYGFNVQTNAKGAWLQDRTLCLDHTAGIVYRIPLDAIRCVAYTDHHVEAW